MSFELILLQNWSLKFTKPNDYKESNNSHALHFHWQIPRSEAYRNYPSNINVLIYAGTFEFLSNIYCSLP